jgi:carboxypeptidase D
LLTADAILNSTLNIPLRGIAIGNGWIDSNSQYLTYLDYAVKVGLIEENTDVRLVFPSPLSISRALQAWKSVKKEIDTCSASITKIHTNRIMNSDCTGVLNSIMKIRERK